MKKMRCGKLSVLLCCIFSIVVLQAAAFQYPSVKGGYTITGSVQQATSGMVYLTYEYNYRLHTDSASLNDGKFVLTGRLPEPLLCTLHVSGTQQIRIFFAENKALRFTGTLNRLFDATLSGSVENDTWMCSQQLLQEVIGGKVTQLRKKLKQTAALDSSVGTKLYDKDRAEIDRYSDSVLTGFTRAHRDRAATACVIYLRYILYPHYTQAAQLHALLNKPIQQSFYGRKILQNIGADSTTAIGKMAPAFSMPDTLGRTISSAVYKGKYVMLDFWASWCGPCRKEHPHLVELYKKYHPQGWEVISISVDSDLSSWKTAIGYDGLLWMQLCDGKGISGIAADLYGVKVVPRNVFIDPSGKIIAKNLRGEALDDFLKRLWP